MTRLRTRLAALECRPGAGRRFLSLDDLVDAAAEAGRRGVLARLRGEPEPPPEPLAMTDEERAVERALDAAAERSRHAVARRLADAIARIPRGETT